VVETTGAGSSVEVELESEFAPPALHAVRNRAKAIAVSFTPNSLSVLR
jgi:hypothetical protein